MKTFIIAEAGVNHNGSVSLAKDLIDAASEAGADAVKFQTFRSTRVASKAAAKARYQNQTTDPHESQLEMLRRLELSKEDHILLLEYCAERGIKFLSTPFDRESATFLAERLDLDCIKLSSGEITNFPLLLHVATFRRRIILSTGMASLGEVETALSVLAMGFQNDGTVPSPEALARGFASRVGQDELLNHVTLLHCTSEYPAPVSDVNLHMMKTMGSAFGLPVGYSDHTLGIAVPMAAVAMGASCIEKHFTLDRGLPGPDHQASLEPHELKEMILGIRDVEAALGSTTKVPATVELENRVAVRKSLGCVGFVRKGDTFTESNLECLRPGHGISPMYYWDYLGQSAPRDLESGELL